MLHDLPDRPADPIIKVMQQFQADTRPDKIDLGVGVYRDPTGATPVMRAVKAAEGRLLAEQTSKGYTPFVGAPEVVTALRDWVLGAAVPAERIAGATTPGGSGAIRQALELAKLARPDARVWISDPTWPNHPGIAEAVGLDLQRYRYRDPDTGGFDADGFWADLEGLRAGDVLILHASCHNPTGLDLSPHDWSRLAELCAQTGAVPLIDAAYLGFGAGVVADGAGLRHLAQSLPEVLVTVSGSKSFGMYRDRVGAVFATGATPQDAGKAQAVLGSLNRLAIGFPPDHGARAATMILTDPELRALWESELAEMRARLSQNRQDFAAALRAELGDGRFDGLAGHRGMFSVLGLSDAVVDALRDVHGVYVVASGRLNIAGLTPDSIPRVAAAISAEL